ncbi:MAG: hypothetical protein U9O24_03960 [Campylobacterota bacterium]|nr:hypothetical protein [Campylobacterota bacterium]
MEISNANSNNKRRLIYVDASGEENNTKFKISIFDPEKNATHTLQLLDVDNNNEAEKFAIFYAVFYIKKHAYTNCHILCDNQSAVNDVIIEKIAKKYFIGVSWIPREANQIADKISKLEPTLKEKEWNLLELFIDLVREHKDMEIDNNDELIQKYKLEIEQLKKTIDTKNKKIKNQATQITQLKSKK